MKSFFQYTLLTFLLVAASTTISLANKTEPTAPKGQVLVKLKPEFAYLNAGGAGMRSDTWNSLVPALSVKNNVAFSSMQNPNSKASRRAANNSGVDIRLYHLISFDPAVPVNEAIDQLYKSGVVDVAEPNYYAKPAYTPNDPLLPQQYYIPLIKADKAWDVTKGDRSIIIAVLDSGVQLDHPDLEANIYRNTNEIANGVDDDNDGFIDNLNGWDFAGADYNNLKGDNNPNVTDKSKSHGTMVAGCAAAVTNNNLGIAGVGFQARIMALKHIADNDTRDGGSGFLQNLLLGVIYAAERDADVINASYGSTSYSIIAQEIYKLAAIGYGATIVAAAGNDNTDEPNYPADYDYVVSVAASNVNDRKASFSNFGYRVDLTAPGAGILTTSVGGEYATPSGTSFAAPLVSGAAALAKSYYPQLDGAQIGELLRVTSDPIFLTNVEPAERDQLGRGRLDVFKALTVNTPSIRMDNTLVETLNGDAPKSGQEAFVVGTFINFLWPTTGAQVKLSAVSSDFVEVLEGTFVLGTLETYGRIRNQEQPFKIRIKDNVPLDAEIILRLDYTAANYTDVQFIKVLVNPAFVNVDVNKISTTITANGRIGFHNGDQRLGKGFKFEGTPLLYELGIIAGIGPEKIVSNVRGESDDIEDDFKSLIKITKEVPGTIADVDVYGVFSDGNAPINERLRIEVDFQALFWREAPYDKLVILEYQVTNTTKNPIENFYFGLYADWDIGEESLDVADWDPATKTGYVYSAAVRERKVAGIQVLTGTPNYFAIDNDHNLNNNPFGVFDGFTDAEKFRSISNGIGRAKAGQTAGGSDVSHSVAAGPFTIAAGETQTIAFALHGGSSVQEVLAAASLTPALYQTTLDTQRPVLGIDKNEIPALNIYPNPTTGAVNLQLPRNAQAYEVRIFDATGKLIYTSRYAGSATKAVLQLPKAKGAYLIMVNQGDKRSVRRIVVQ